MISQIFPLNKSWGCYIVNRGFIWSNEKNIAFEDILLPLLEEYDFPIIKCHDFGHGGNNCVLPIGAMTTICGFSSEVIINDEVLK